MPWFKNINNLGKQAIKIVQSDVRSQKLLALSSEKETLSRQIREKKLNQNLKVSLISTGFATIGALLYSPLGWLSVPGILYISKTVFNDAYHALIKQHKVNVDLLIIISNSLLLFGGHLFWCSVSVVLYAVNHKLLHTIKTNAKSSLIDVFRQQSQVAWVIQNGTECEIPISALTLDSIIVVGAGEVVPVDGRIIAGMASIDQHILTGESQPAEKTIDDQVFAATIVLSGKIHIQVAHIGEQTTAAQIGHILNQTADTKTQKQLQVEALSDKTILPTLITSAAVVPFLGPLGALSVLQSHFKHRMSIVSAIGLMNYLNLAAHQGLLIKSGDVLEQLNTVDTIVFDKTGTLTEEIPEIGKIHLCADYNSDTILQYAAAAEGKQTHPIARAIVQAAQAKNLNIPNITQADYQVGFGVSVIINQQLVQLGSIRFMETLAIELPEWIQTTYTASTNVGHSMILLAIAGQLVAGIELHPKVRPEAKHIITNLRKNGIEKTYIISGDHAAPTQKLAETLEIDDYFAEVLPEQKAELIAQLQQAGRTVCFIGDGINDCIAMHQADVSISLGDASTVAIDTAQVILLDNNLTQLCELFDLSTAFITRAKTSYAIVTLPGILGISGTLFFHFGLTPVMILPQIGLIIGVLHSIYPLLQNNQIQETKVIKNSSASYKKSDSKRLNG